MKISKKLIKKMATLPAGTVRNTTGKVVSAKWPDGSWTKWKRDANGQIVSIKRSDGTWVKYKRASNGKIVSTTTIN